MKIYIVMGATGQYDDYQEWAIVAYKDEELAKQHVEKATQKAAELLALAGNDTYTVDKSANQYDPRMVMDYTGTEYHYIDIEVLDAIPVEN